MELRGAEEAYAEQLAVIDRRVSCSWESFCATGERSTRELTPGRRVSASLTPAFLSQAKSK